MRETLSPYKNYVIASKKKVLLTNIADYLLTFILTFLLFSVAGSPILAALPVTQESYDVLVNHIDTLYQTIDDTHLQRYNKVAGSLSDLNVDGKAYALTLAKTSYFVLDLDFPYVQKDGTYVEHAVPVEETFLGDLETYALDAPSYYFLHFKEAQASLNDYVYDGVDYRDNKIDYLYQKAFTYSKADWFTQTSPELPKYQQLTESRARSLMAYVVYSERSTAPQETYTEILRGYKAAVNSFIGEVEKKYTPILEEMDRFNAALKSYDGIILIDYHLCFLAAILILEAVLPLILKQGRTVGCRAFKLAYSTEDEMAPSFWRYLIKSTLRLLIHYSSLFFCLAITSSYSLAFVSFGWFSVSMPLLASMVLGVASIVMVAARKTNQGLAETGARLYLKDTTQMEQGTPEEERSVTTDGNH